MELFITILIILILVVMFFRNKNSSKASSPTVINKNFLIKQKSLSLLLTHHKCSEKEIKKKILSNLAIYEMSLDNMKNHASIFLAKAREEALERSIHVEDTQSFIISEWIAEFYENEKLQQDKDLQIAKPISKTSTKGIVPDEKILANQRNGNTYRTNLEDLAKMYECLVQDVKETYLVKCGASAATDADLMLQIRKLEIVKNDVGAALGCHPDDTTFGIMQSWSSQYILTRKLSELENARIKYGENI